MEAHNVEQHSWYLDDKNEDSVLVKYKYSPARDRVIEFVIVYLTIVDGEPKEVIKYDFSQREALNVHYYYRKPPAKQFIPSNPYPSFEEMWKHVEYIHDNWRSLKRKYKE